MPQLIMMSVFIANNGGPDEHPFGVVSGKYKKSPGVHQNVNHSSRLLMWEFDVWTLWLWKVVVQKLLLMLLHIMFLEYICH